MYPIYKFFLTAGLATAECYPMWRELTKDYEKQSGQEFFRAKLNGTLTFEAADYQTIASAAIDTKFLLEVQISQDGGTTWTSYWTGEFWKTDCEFDADSRTVSVKASVRDRYTDVLAGMEREFNLIDLAPDIIPIKADKRPMVQVYVPGDTVVGCFLAGMWWEQECDAESDETRLYSRYHFLKNKAVRFLTMTGTQNPDVTGLYIGSAPASPTDDYEISNGTYTFRYEVTYSPPQNQWKRAWSIVRDADGTVLFYFQALSYEQPTSWDYSVTLFSVSGVSTGTVDISITDQAVYARMVLDTDMQGVTTWDLPSDDIVPQNRNYHKVALYNSPASIGISTRMSATATEWGLYQPGQYYLPPDDTPDVWSPLARAVWREWSLWFDLTMYDWNTEAAARAAFEIRHAYPISSVISVLLGQIAPGVTHEGTTDYSQFLYGTNLLGIAQTVLITPKSNIVSAGYDQPAQKAPITLKGVLNMLRDCFRCYWYIDDENRFRVEHIEYFRNGGSYDTTPSVGVDLTAMQRTRNGKPWSFALDKWKYEKPDMTGRYQFGWMDACTRMFEGYPIDIVSGYVDKERIEDITVSGYTSDIDYILLNPSEVSLDSFVLLAAAFQNGRYELPYITMRIGSATYVLQNGWAAFTFMQQYYAWDMPAWSYVIHGVQMTAQGVKRLKSQQVTFPAKSDPDVLRLIKTGLGSGVIEKLSITLTARAATADLRYDTEQ